MRLVERYANGRRFVESGGVAWSPVPLGNRHCRLKPSGLFCRERAQLLSLIARSGCVEHGRDLGFDADEIRARQRREGNGDLVRGDELEQAVAAAAMRTAEGGILAGAGEARSTSARADAIFHAHDLAEADLARVRMLGTRSGAHLVESFGQPDEVDGRRQLEQLRKMRLQEGVRRSGLLE